MSKIKIILADDHPLIRAGFKTLLGKNEDFEILGEAGNGKELINLVKVQTPDIVLIDISMPEMSGLDAFVEIRKELPDIKFIVLSMHEEREYVLKAVRNGINGYLLKNVGREELEDAIRNVHAGGKCFSPVVAGILADSIQAPEESPGLITSREKEVLSLVAEGFSTKQIADKLDISARTVESHRVNLLKKLKVNNTAELIKKASENKLI